MTFTAPLRAFAYWEKNTPNQLMFHQPFMQGPIKMSYEEAGIEIRKLAQALINLDYAPKSKIALLSKNCSHWIMADLAIQMAGHISVPIYPTINADSIAQIMTHSESKAIIIGKLDNVVAGSAQLIKPAKNNEAQSHSCTLSTFFFASWARGFGLAKAVFQKAELKAKQEGFKVINLEVRETQLRAIQLYEQAGFIDCSGICFEASLADTWIGDGFCDGVNETFSMLGKDMHLMVFHPDYDAEKAGLDFLIDDNVVDPSLDYCMVFVQRLSTLDDAALSLEKSGYYKHFPVDVFDSLVIERRRLRNGRA